MRFREFIGSFSIYGFLPVFTKSASFLLVPIYVRVFSAFEFGIVELLISSVHFFIFAINLEFYGAIGRFFFERDTVSQKRKLISTGLWMTVSTAAIVLLISLINENSILQAIFKSQEYRFEFRLGLIWAVFAAISTYLSVIPRYEKKAKKYVVYNASSLVAKLLSTVIFVVMLDLGIAGVIWGNITGAVLSTILYGSASKKYLGFSFSKNDFREISKFAIPLVPGLLIIGLFQPVMRTLVTRIYSTEHLGLFGLAARIVTIMVIVETGIRLSWRPLLYENINKNNFGKEYNRISKFVGRLILAAGIFVTLFSKEVLEFIATPEYLDARFLVGFLVIGNALSNLTTLRGFGFEVEKKTYLISLTKLFAYSLGVLFLIYGALPFGLIGIGISFIIPMIIIYLIQVNYTKRIIATKKKDIVEYILWVVLIISTMIVLIDISIYYRILIYIMVILISIPYSYLNHKVARTINARV